MTDVTKLGAEMGQTVRHRDLPILAHTTWNLLWPGHLISPESSQIWETETQAKCFGTYGGRPLKHSAPDFSCVCGLRGYRRIGSLIEDASARRNHVYGTVELYGRIVEQALGFRAEFARVRNLILTDGTPYTIELTELLENLRRRYGGIEIEYNPNFWASHPTKLMRESLMITPTSSNPSKSHPKEWAEFKREQRLAKVMEHRRQNGLPLHVGREDELSEGNESQAL